MVTFFHEQLEREARRLSRESQRAAAQERKRRCRREIYQQYAAQFIGKIIGKSVYECDLLVARQRISELLAERSGQKLRADERGKVGRILLQGPVAQQLKQTKGEAASKAYAMEVLMKAQKVIEKSQHLNRSRQRSQDKGMDL